MTPEELAAYLAEEPVMVFATTAARDAVQHDGQGPDTDPETGDEAATTDHEWPDGDDAA